MGRAVYGRIKRHAAVFKGVPFEHQASSKARTQHRKKRKKRVAASTSQVNLDATTTQKVSFVNSSAADNGFFIALQARLEARLGQLRVVMGAKFSLFFKLYANANEYSRSGRCCNTFKFCKYST